MLMGTTFAGTPTAISSACSATEKINEFHLTGMVIDELYVTKDVLLKFNWEIPEAWDYNTHLHGHYRGDTMAGNVAYAESMVSAIKIKKRFQGEFTWKTIYEKEINSNEDFSIEFYDYLEPHGKVVEYAYVAVIAGADTDTNAVSNSVESELYYDFICERDVSYPLILDFENTLTYNRESNVIVSPGRKYPYVVNKGVAKYYSGKINVTFIELKDCKLDIKNGWSYRNKLDQFLTDGDAKILKTTEGDMWMVNVVGSLPRTVNNHYQYVSHSIDWVEAGNPLMVGDLYDNGFIDTDVDRE